MKINKIITILLVFIMIPSFAFAQTVNELNSQITEKQQDIEAIKKKIATYQQNISQKQAETRSLKNELLILENKIAKTELDIQEAEAEIEKNKLEIRNAELEIITTEDKISHQQENLANLIQEIHKTDNESTLKIFVLNDNISDFFNEVENVKNVQYSLQDNLLEIKNEKKALVQKKSELDQKQTQLQELKDVLDLNKMELAGENEYKNNLLVSTKNSEQKFQELYSQAKQEQQNISNEIYNLEKAARAKLEEEEKNNTNTKPILSNSTLIWPIPFQKITTYFHDPDYPFKYLFEHPAIDLRAAQGTKIVAPAEGYVLRAKDAGMGYSYISLIHADGLSTVYGHVSKIYVNEDEYVSKGEVIGLTGGMPGTPGAGNLTTGPHLHFEVRLNGIPVNPLDYLPSP